MLASCFGPGHCLSVRLRLPANPGWKRLLIRIFSLRVREGKEGRLESCVGRSLCAFHPSSGLALVGIMAKENALCVEN